MRSASPRDPQFAENALAGRIGPSPELGDYEYVHICENMREIDTLGNVDMQQRKNDDSITKKFIQSIGE